MKNQSVSDRNFGFVISALFSVAGARSLLTDHQAAYVGYGLLLIAVIIMLTSMFAPRLLHPLNGVWTGFGTLMGRIMTPVAMLIIYVCAVLPTAWVMRILGKDPLLRTKNKETDSYWLARTYSPDLSSSMKDQF